MIRKIYTIIAAVLILLVYIQIFQFSDAPAEISAVQSMSVAQQIIEFAERVFAIDLPFNDSPEQIDQADGVVRKMAHFSEYALLGLLTYSIAICWDRKNKKGTARTFLFVVILATLDELHQYFVPGRYCSLRDVCIDSAGCLTGMLILNFLYGRYSRHRLKGGRIS